MAQPSPPSKDSPSIQTPALTAIYQSPTNPSFRQTLCLPSLPSNPTITEKTSYLTALRKATAQLQESVNKELTARMEEDKSREATNGTGAGAGAKNIDEAKEEDNYGEEVVEED